MAPLSGRRIVVTRPRDRAGPLIAALEAEGAEVIVAPMIEIVPPEDPGPLRDAAARLGEYDWVVFTSVYAVRALAEAVGEGRRTGGARSGRAAKPLTSSRRPQVGCVGVATGRAAEAAGWVPDLVARQRTGGGLAAALLDAGAGPGTRVLFPRAADAREELPARLREAGVGLEEVVAYAKTAPSDPGNRLRKSLAEGRIDVLTFTAPSTVRNFAGHFGATVLALPAVVIGPTTASAAEAEGFRRVVVAGESSIDGLVRAVTQIFED